MQGLRQSRLLLIAATAAFILMFGGRVRGLPKLTTGIAVTINGQGPFTYSKDGAAKQFKERGYIVQGSTQPDVYKITIPRTAANKLDKLAWKTVVPCAGSPDVKEGAVQGFLQASTAGKISLRAG
jgi:hypothetical protein